MKKQQKVIIQPKTIEFLQKKYRNEQIILQKDNIKLQQQLHNEIERYNIQKINYEKKIQLIQGQIEGLHRQKDKLQMQLLMQQKQVQPEETYEEDMANYLRKQKELIMEYSKVKQMLSTAEDTVIVLQEHNKKLQNEQIRILEENQYLKKNFEILEAELNTIRTDKDQIMKQSILISNQLEEIIRKERNVSQELRQKCEKNNFLKNKKKQLEYSLESLEQNFKKFEESELKKYELGLNILKKDKEQLHQKTMQMSTKIQFLNLNLHQKDEYIKNYEEQNQEKQKNFQEREKKLMKAIEDAENERNRIKIELENQKSQNIQQMQAQNKRMEEDNADWRKKLAQQLFSLMRTENKNGNNQQTLENYIEGLRNCKSQSTMLNNLQPFTKNPAGSQSNQNLEKMKLGNHINCLQSSIHSYKQQIQILTAELQNSKESIKQQFMHKNMEFQEYRIKTDKNEQLLNKQLVALRAELLNKRNCQTEFLELKRNKIEFQDAMCQKVSHWESKYRQGQGIIERKEQINEKLRNTRFELEAKCKIAEQKVLKARQQVDNLKRYKIDCQRKDELMKDYKNKYERTNDEMSKLKIDCESLRKDKIKLQKNIEAKETYIHANKQGIHKQNLQLEEKVCLLNKDLKIMRQSKHTLEQKVKKYKKQLEECFATLSRFRQQLMKKMLIYFRRDTKQQNIHQNQEFHEWQAAQLLGLKSSELKEFVYPCSSITKDVLLQLQQLWQQGKYDFFLERCLNYLLMQVTQ